MNGVTQREWSFLLLLWGLSDPRIAELREMPQSFIIKLYSETQVSGRLGMSGGRSPRHAQNPLSGERRKTLSITHHALSPPHSHHHLYIIHLINWLQRFYRITMSLKRPFVPKSDVKQWFTTTIYIYITPSSPSHPALRHTQLSKAHHQTQFSITPSSQWLSIPPSSPSHPALAWFNMPCWLRSEQGIMIDLIEKHALLLAAHWTPSNGNYSTQYIHIYSYSVACFKYNQDTKKCYD